MYMHCTHHMGEADTYCTVVLGLASHRHTLLCGELGEPHAVIVGGGSHTGMCNRGGGIFVCMYLCTAMDVCVLVWHVVVVCVGRHLHMYM